MAFDFHRGMPRYLQIKEDLVRRITAGAFVRKLSSETQLAEEYGVSRPTVRQAMRELVQEGLVTRARGRGTFIIPKVITSDAQTFQSFTEEMRHKGIRYSVKLVGAREITAIGPVADELGIEDGQSVYEITRLFYGDGEPLVLRISQVSTRLCPGLLKKNVEQDPLYALLANDYGLRPASSVERFSAMSAFKRQAILLDVEPGAPLLVWRGVILSAEGKPLVRTKGFYRGDRYQFVLRRNAVSPQVPVFDMALVGTR